MSMQTRTVVGDEAQELLETPSERVLATVSGESSYWPEEVNRARSEKLKGQTMSFDRRAQMYASHVTGKRAGDNDPAWMEAYRHRLSDLRMQEHLRQMAERGELGNKPIEAPLITQIGKLMRKVTVCRVDSFDLANELGKRNLSFDTLRLLANWAGLSQQQVDEIVQGRAESVVGR